MFGVRRVNADQSSVGVAGRQGCYLRGVSRGAVDFIKLDEAGLFSAHAAAGVLESPVSNESAVRRFLEFLAQPEGGGGIFRKHGYKVSLPVAMPVKAAPR